MLQLVSNSDNVPQIAGRVRVRLGKHAVRGEGRGEERGECIDSQTK